MLKSLHISNYALINELDIDFSDGMTVLTGETGAGKSIIIGALSLVMGQRADTKVIKEGETKAVVEIGFDVNNYNLQPFFEDNELDYYDVTVIRREVMSNGKSRAFVNDTPVQLTLLKNLSDKLIDIHSQHENLLLATENYQLQVVDNIAENSLEKDEYQAAFEKWTQAKDYLQKLRNEAEKQRADLDYIEFQLTQLDEAKLTENEEEELEVELETLSHVEEIKTELQHAETLLESEDFSVLSALKESRNVLLKIQAYLPESEKWSERLEEVFIELKDILSDISSNQDKIDFNPERLEYVDNRLGVLISLQKKFKVENIKALINLRESFRKQINRIGNMDDEIQESERKLDACFEDLKTAAEKLSKSRKKIFPFIEKTLIEKLSLLGMPDIRFKVDCAELQSFTQTGKDQITFLFSANKNRSVQPVTDIASGGEISRLMLAIKSMLISKADLPTIIFDEIDTGVSGDIAGRMGEIMKLMSSNSQVIAITHLPQIAAKGKEHFQVYKDNSGKETITFIKKLTPNERIKEIAQMLSGKSVTEAAMMNAMELMR
ncbi:MAG: DNA repair protein RecN [Porphyromonadaceae bacterium]|jgi:DNA repair protein RecN (Recombination protein N)|nr:DNA repair protein RecN [Porphyromonadaceae bacterium]